MVKKSLKSKGRESRLKKMTIYFVTTDLTSSGLKSKKQIFSKMRKKREIKTLATGCVLKNMLKTCFHISDQLSETLLVSMFEWSSTVRHDQQREARLFLSILTIVIYKEKKNW